MPVTAKLSRQFYDRLGDEIANELVEWLNQVDLSFRTELRELNESNFARSDAKSDQRFAEFELKLERRMAAFEAKVDRRFAEVEVNVDRRFAELRGEFDRRLIQLEATIETGFERVRGDMTSFKAELIKWMFLFWLGTVATTLAISQALQ
jgi:CRP-like cAMP-binding protein